MRRAKGAPRKGRRKKFRTLYVQGILQRRFACLREKRPIGMQRLLGAASPLRQLKTSIGMLCLRDGVPFWQRTYAGNSRENMRLGRHGGAKTPQEMRRRRKKSNRVRLLKTRASQGCNKKTFRRALSFDLKGEIAYNLCITTCGVCRKNKGVTVC